MSNSKPKASKTSQRSDSLKGTDAPCPRYVKINLQITVDMNKIARKSIDTTGFTVHTEGCCC